MSASSKTERAKLADIARRYCEDELRARGQVFAMFFGMTPGGGTVTVPIGGFMENADTKEMGALVIRRFARTAGVIAAAFVSEVWHAVVPIREYSNQMPMPSGRPDRVESVWIAVEDQAGTQSTFFAIVRDESGVRMGEERADMAGSMPNRFSVFKHRGGVENGPDLPA